MSSLTDKARAECDAQHHASGRVSLLDFIVEVRHLPSLVAALRRHALRDWPRRGGRGVGVRGDHVGFEGLSSSEIASHPETINLFNQEVESRMEPFAQYEKIKKFTVIDRLFELERNEITPSLKIRRKAVTDNFKEIIDAMKLIWERLKIICEPSCSLPLAVVLKNQPKYQNKSIGLILTGGNVDLSNLPF